VDGARGFGNGWLLPAGPLREPVSRLAEVGLVVVNGDTRPAGVAENAAHLRLAGDTLYNLRDPAQRRPAQSFAGQPVHAVAGIGDPDRFFRHLRTLGLAVSPHPFPDHHAFRPVDLEIAGTDAIVMTEKDAVKCRAFGSERCWVLPVEAKVDDTVGAAVLQRLRAR
jgi:tetraacyldisaccharide 4'-kinase